MVLLLIALTSHYFAKLLSKIIPSAMAPSHATCMLVVTIAMSLGLCHSLATAEVEREELRRLLSGVRAARRVLVRCSYRDSCITS